MRTKLLTMLAGFAFLVCLAISAKAQDIDVAMDNYDVVSGTNPGLGGASAYASVSVTGSSGDWTVTVTSGGGANGWDLGTDADSNAFFFDASGDGSVTDIEINGADPPWGVTDTDPLVPEFGSFSYAIFGPPSTLGVYTLSFHYSGTSIGNTFAGYLVGGPGENCMYVSNVSPVPEPGTLALLGTGLISLAWFIRRRRTA